MNAARVTVIDRTAAPRAFDRAGTTPHDPAVLARLAKLRNAAQGRDAEGILRLALAEEFAGRTAVVSSFGAESVVHPASRRRHRAGNAGDLPQHR